MQKTKENVSERGGEWVTNPYTLIHGKCTTIDDIR
jgi:hypothetical protein